MPAYIYSVNNANNFVGQSFEQFQLKIIKWFLSTLKSAGWFTRGSSISGSAGHIYSATPDGVDGWTGATDTQIFDGANVIWQVLEHPTTGAQICLTWGTATNTLGLIYAKNKFETAGAWRTSTAVGTRPTDVTSTLAVEREIPLNASPSLRQWNFGINYYHIIARDDGAAAFIYCDAPGSGVDDPAVMGFAMLRTTNMDDTNPVVTWSASGGTAYPSYYQGTVTPIESRDTSVIGALHAQWFGVIKATGCFGEFAPGTADLFDSLLPLADIFDGKGRLGPLTVWSSNSTPAYFRGTIPDLQRAMTAWGNRDLINDKTFIKLGAYAFPWDGQTDMGGAARSASFLAFDVEQTAGGAGGEGVTAFWTAMEKL